MKPLPAIPDTFQPKFDEMWRSACRVCDNIHAFQPDLVLVLMHSGWGPVFAAQIVWLQTQSLPFPPVARTNIGREKIGIFDDTFRLTTDYFVGEYSSYIEVGKLLAWLTTRSDWREQLRQQVAEAMQTAESPQRILVVDDTMHEGSTSILTLGLLNWVYPQATIRFLIAHSWYRSTYRDFMLASLCSASELFPEGKIPSDEVRYQLGNVAIGSENVFEDSLLWQPISVDSPSVQALSVYLPANEWVQISQEIYSSVARYITERSASYTPKDPDPRDFNFGLRNEWRMMSDIWLENGITRRQAEQRYGLSNREVSRLLDTWMSFDELVLEGHGRGARYRIPAPLRQHIEKVNEFPEELLDAYWLLPGKLMFGEHPSYLDCTNGDEWARKQMRYLLDQGIDYWMDVQIIEEGKAPKEYPLFGEEACAIERSAVAQAVSLVIKYISKEGFILIRRGRPNRKDIRSILDQIDQHLADGRVLYVSTISDTLRGTLAGCYLARHGQAGTAALAVLQARRATSTNGWKREPASRKARRYVRSWPAGF